MVEMRAKGSTDPSQVKPLDDASPGVDEDRKKYQPSDFALALLLLVMAGVFSIMLFEGAERIALILAVPGVFFLIRGSIRALRGEK